MVLGFFKGNSDKKDWNEKQKDSEENNFSISNPDLRAMAQGNPETIKTLSPVEKLTESAVKILEEQAKDMQVQVQRHGRAEASKTSIFKSRKQISDNQYTHGQVRLKEGLKARDKATQFGEFVNTKARPEFTSQNYRYMLSQEAGNRTIKQLGQEFDQAVNDLNSCLEDM